MLIFIFSLCSNDSQRMLAYCSVEFLAYCRRMEKKSPFFLSVIVISLFHFLILRTNVWFKNAFSLFPRQIFILELVNAFLKCKTEGFVPFGRFNFGDRAFDPNTYSKRLKWEIHYECEFDCKVWLSWHHVFFYS